jgi:RNA recognition motif-containing protein
MGRKLFVGNLPFQTTEDELHDLFSQVDSVETVTVMRDQMTGRARGFAFVEMSSDEGAQKAIDQLNNTQLGGRTLAINEARPKVPRAGGGFGGDGGERRGGFGGGGGGNRRREPRW